MPKHKRLRGLIGLALLAPALIAATILAGRPAGAVCEHVAAGCDDCTVCQRWYMVGDDLCYESYYFCVNTCTGAIDGYHDDRCEPW